MGQKNICWVIVLLIELELLEHCKEAHLFVVRSHVCTKTHTHPRSRHPHIYKHTTHLAISWGELRTRRHRIPRRAEHISTSPLALLHPYLSSLHHISIFHRGVPPTQCWHIKGLRQIRTPPRNLTAMSQLFWDRPDRRWERPGMTKDLSRHIKKWIFYFPLRWVKSYQASLWVEVPRSSVAWLTLRVKERDDLNHKVCTTG